MLAAAAIGFLYLFEPSPRDGAVAVPELPGSPAIAETQPEHLSNPDGVSRYAVVQGAADALAAPEPGARIVGRIKTRTPEGTENVVLALERVTKGGRDWVRVRLPVLPNNTTGWVPRESLGLYNDVETRLVVSRSQLRATLYRGGKEVWSAPVGIGLDKWATPKGHFYVRNKLEKYSSPKYGPIAFGTSARSTVLTDWPAGGFVGIHGTDRPELLPGKVSHGCIRLRNEDILALAELMPVGTPLTIR